MGKASLRIELLEFTKNATSIIYAACRQCYSSKFAAEILKTEYNNLDEQESFIKNIVASGHESPLEHVKFTFAVEGVSRALTHQLIRHRLASYSQQSQRYVKETEFDYIIPPMIEEDTEAKKIFVETMNNIQKSYNKLIELFSKKGKNGEQINQDVRFVLPQATETKIVITMNCRELIHFFEQRLCMRSQWEIRNLAREMLKICKEILPSVFGNIEAKCKNLGYCPESDKYSCRKYPLKSEVIKN